MKKKTREADKCDGELGYQIINKLYTIVAYFGRKVWYDPVVNTNYQHRLVYPAPLIMIH